MPLLALYRNRHVAVLAGAAFALSVLAAPAAQAFTMQDQNGNLSLTDQSFLYPDRGVTSAGSGQAAQGFKQEDGMTTFKEGNTTLQFGHRKSFDERFNTDRLFDPLGHPPGVR